MNELTTTTQGAMAPYEAPDALAGMAKIKIDYLNLIQGTSRTVGATSGKWRDSATGEEFDSITLVPLTLSPGREYFQDKADFSKPPLCKSLDGVYPGKFVETPQASSCKSCRYSTWRKEGTRNIRPACDETRSMLVIAKETELPYYIKFKGNGLAPLQEYIDRLEKQRVKTKAKTGRKPNIFEYQFTLKTQKIIGASGTYFVPVFADFGYFGDEDAGAAFGPFYQQFVIDAKNHVQQEDNLVDVALNDIGSAPDNSPIDAEFVDA